MLQKVAGENFQGYEEFEIEFHPGVNVIIGKSDAGKSAAFRLVDWVRTNRPLGDAFRSEWGGDTKGQIWTTEGDTVLRVKGDKQNYYQINDNTPLKAFGQNPPDEIFSVLQLDDINMQTQEASPFLLSNSAGEVARVLNQAASLQDIDTVTSNLTKGLRTASRNIESTQGLLVTQKEELSKYDTLPELEKKIIELEHLERHHTSIRNQRNALYNLFQSIIGIRSALKKVVDVEAISGLLSEAAEINEKREKVQKEFDTLGNIYHDLTITRKTIKIIELEIKRSQKAYDELAPESCPLCGGPMK